MDVFGKFTIGQAIEIDEDDAQRHGGNQSSQLSVALLVVVERFRTRGQYDEDVIRFVVLGLDRPSRSIGVRGDVHNGFQRVFVVVDQRIGLGVDAVVVVVIVIESFVRDRCRPISDVAHGQRKKKSTLEDFRCHAVDRFGPGYGDALRRVPMLIDAVDGVVEMLETLRRTSIVERVNQMEGIVIVAERDFRLIVEQPDESLAPRLHLLEILPGRRSS